MISSRLVLTIAIFGSAAKTTMAVDPIKCANGVLLVVSGCFDTAAVLNDAVNHTGSDKIICDGAQARVLNVGGGGCETTNSCDCDATAAALNDVVNDTAVDAIICQEDRDLFVDGDCLATACALNALVGAYWSQCTPAPTAVPTAAPTPAPTPQPWQAAMNGCCRQHVPGRKRGNPPVISQETIDGGTMADAIDKCKQLCNDESTCTAVEVRPIKKKKWNKKNKKNKKKTSKGFACELHRSINASSRKSKSCKKAKCFTMDQSE